jgi:lipoprotein NlpI
MRARGLVFAWLALVPIAGTAADDKTARPLLELAAERALNSDHQPRPAPGNYDLREAQHQLEQARVPPASECAGSIGATRFANVYIELAGARSSQGDFAGAADAFRSAHTCRPRDANILAALAGALFDARDFAGARAAIDASLAIDPRSVSSTRLAGNLDFVIEHWADAIGHFRYAAASEADRFQADYMQIMFWLAQRRGGIARPESVARTPGEGWPQPLLLFLRGEYTEDELIEPIRAGDDTDNPQPNTSTDERLCEALFYVGEEYWARGQPEVAREYFIALVNLRVVYFMEHGLALAEIAKLRER